jgi:hypothetical protein
MKFVKQGVLVLCIIAFCKQIDQTFDSAKKKVEEATE